MQSHQENRAINTHSPLPWKQDGCVVRDRDGLPVAYCRGVRGDTTSPDEENAKSIVQAANSQASIPHHAICFFRDGDKWCCIYGDFIDLQTSPAGFGDTFEEAVRDLQTLR